MKKIIVFCVMLLIFPALLFTGVFLLPVQYEETFLGELKYKWKLLSETEQKKIVFVGGSSVAFGIDSALIRQEFPEYEVVNFGMYAALGTKTMLDLSADQIGAGDVVIMIPEQQEQTLSLYFNGEYLWQALDGAFYLLRELPPEDYGKLLGTLPHFSAEKWKRTLTGTKFDVPEVYQRSSFNLYGDLVSEKAACNIMPDGFDRQMPIELDKNLPGEEFAAYLNSYAEEALKRGAAVWYHFCPMNRAAVKNPEEIEDYYEELYEKLEFPIAGDPKDCLMEPGWFYDTNFHLNSSGKTVYTKQMVKDLKAVFGDSSPTKIDLPAMPELFCRTEEEPVLDNSDSGYFLWELKDGEAVLTGLTEEGKEQKELTVPFSVEGCTVRRLYAKLFCGNTKIEKVILQNNISWIENGAFEGCSRLKAIVLLEKDPSRCLVGEGLLDGTDSRILVPAEAQDAYRLHYSWSVYGDRIETDR